MRRRRRRSTGDALANAVDRMYAPPPRAGVPSDADVVELYRETLRGTVDGWESVVSHLPDDDVDGEFTAGRDFRPSDRDVIDTTARIIPPALEEDDDGETA